MKEQLEFNKKRTCLVGIGNSLRSDDGVGNFVCNQLEKEGLPGVSFIIAQQLDIGLTEEIAKFDTVIFIDAAQNVDSFSFKEIPLDKRQPQSFSHHLNVDMLVSLSKQLFPSDTIYYICAIGADEFKLGSELSERTMKNAQDAVTAIISWIYSND